MNLKDLDKVTELFATYGKVKDQLAQLNADKGFQTQVRIMRCDSFSAPDWKVLLGDDKNVRDIVKHRLQSQIYVLEGQLIALGAFPEREPVQGCAAENDCEQAEGA